MKEAYTFAAFPKNPIRIDFGSIKKEFGTQVEKLLKCLPFKLFESDLDLLIKNYHLEQSYLSQFARWYDERSFWGTVLLTGGILLSTVLLYHLAIITGSALVIINLLAWVLSVGIGKIVSNHLAVEQRRCERICVGVKKLQVDLENSIKTFQLSQSRLTNLFQEIEKQNGAFEGYVLKLEQQTELLIQEAEKFAEIVSELKKTHELFNEETQPISDSEKTILKQLEELQRLINEQITLVVSGDQKVSSTKEDLKASVSFFASIHQTLEELQQSHKSRFSSLKEANKVLEEDISAEKEAFAKIEQTMSQSSDVDLQVNQQLKEAIEMNSRAQALLLQAESFYRTSKLVP